MVRHPLIVDEMGIDVIGRRLLFRQGGEYAAQVGVGKLLEELVLMDLFHTFWSVELARPIIHGRPSGHCGVTVIPTTSSWRCFDPRRLLGVLTTKLYHALIDVFLLRIPRLFD